MAWKVIAMSKKSTPTVSELEREITALKLQLHASELVNLANNNETTRIHPSAQDEFKRQAIEQYELYFDGTVKHKLRLDDKEVLKDMRRDSFYLFADHVEQAPAKQETSYDPAALSKMSKDELWDLHHEELARKT